MRAGSLGWVALRCAASEARTASVLSILFWIQVLHASLAVSRRVW